MSQESISQLRTLIENPPAVLALLTASIIDPELAIWLSFSITILEWCVLTTMGGDMTDIRVKSCDVT